MNNRINAQRHQNIRSQQTTNKAALSSDERCISAKLTYRHNGKKFFWNLCARMHISAVVNVSKILIIACIPQVNDFCIFSFLWKVNFLFIDWYILRNAHFVQWGRAAFRKIMSYCKTFYFAWLILINYIQCARFSFKLKCVRNIKS